mmetsp:Transcript_8895/g.26659  ORF Transcript_8895/g.26659 Transcript_8895/m.26659 type:complete len:80 (-) Transcript_8895:35-274(-)
MNARRYKNPYVLVPLPDHWGGGGRESAAKQGGGGGVRDGENAAKLYPGGSAWFTERRGEGGTGWVCDRRGTKGGRRKKG